MTFEESPFSFWICVLYITSYVFFILLGFEDTTVIAAATAGALVLTAEFAARDERRARPRCGECECGTFRERVLHSGLVTLECDNCGFIDTDEYLR